MGCDLRGDMRIFGCDTEQICLDVARVLTTPTPRTNARNPVLLSKMTKTENGTLIHADKR